MFYHIHPNMFDLVEKLKFIQTNNYLKVRASLTELPLERQEKVKVMKMKAYQDDFTSGTINRKEYIHKMVSRGQHIYFVYLANGRGTLYTVTNEISLY